MIYAWYTKCNWNKLINKRTVYINRKYDLVNIVLYQQCVHFQFNPPPHPRALPNVLAVSCWWMQYININTLTRGGGRVCKQTVMLSFLTLFYNSASIFTYKTTSVLEIYSIDLNANMTQNESSIWSKGRHMQPWTFKRLQTEGPVAFSSGPRFGSRISPVRIAVTTPLSFSHLTLPHSLFGRRCKSCQFRS